MTQYLFSLYDILSSELWHWSCAKQENKHATGLKKEPFGHIIEQIIFPLNGMISPGVEGHGMGQDLFFSSSKCCCQKNCANHVCSLWMFLLKCHHGLPSLAVETQPSTAIPFVANMTAVCKGRVEHYQPCLVSASSFSFCVSSYEWRLHVRILQPAAC